MNDLQKAREKLDILDEKIISLLNKRMEIIKEIALFKKANNLPIIDALREKALIEENKKFINVEFHKYYKQLYKTILDVSKNYQHDLFEERLKECN